MELSLDGQIYPEPTEEQLTTCFEAMQPGSFLVIDSGTPGFFMQILRGDETGATAYLVEYREGDKGIFANNWTSQNQATWHARQYLAGSDAYKKGDNWQAREVDLDVLAGAQATAGASMRVPLVNETQGGRILRQLVRAEYFEAETVTLSNLSRPVSAGEYLRTGYTGRVFNILAGLIYVFGTVVALLLLVPAVIWKTIQVAFGPDPMPPSGVLLAVIGTGALGAAHVYLFGFVTFSGLLFMLRKFRAKPAR